MRIALEINSMPFQNKIIIYLKRSDVFLSIRRRYFCDFILENNWDNFWKQKIWWSWIKSFVFPWISSSTILVDKITIPIYYFTYISSNVRDQSYKWYDVKFSKHKSFLDL